MSPLGADLLGAGQGSGALRTCTVSVVSHGQGPLVSSFLDDLDRRSTRVLEVIVVVNLPEDEAYLRAVRSFPITVIRNPAPRGFGANHNQALRRANGDVFVIANPDIRLEGDPLPALIDMAQRPEVGICGPKVVSRAGTLEDSARKFPTLASLARRRLMGRRGPDYAIDSAPVAVDWIAGMFMVCRRDVFVALGGFDERYFLYFEDVDLCDRARKRGLEVMVEPAACVVHDARRASHRNPRYLYWHLRAAARYLAARGRSTPARS